MPNPPASSPASAFTRGIHGPTVPAMTACAEKVAATATRERASASPTLDIDPLYRTEGVGERPRPAPTGSGREPLRRALARAKVHPVRLERDVPLPDLAPP